MIDIKDFKGENMKTTKLFPSLFRNPEKVNTIFIDKETEENKLFVKQLNEISTHNGTIETITSLEDLYIIEFIDFLEENFILISDVDKFKQLILAYSNFAEGLINIAQTGRKTGIVFLDNRTVKLNLPLLKGLEKYGLDYSKAMIFLNNLQ